MGYKKLSKRTLCGFSVNRAYKDEEYILAYKSDFLLYMYLII